MFCGMRQTRLSHSFYLIEFKPIRSQLQITGTGGGGGVQNGRGWQVTFYPYEKILRGSHTERVGVQKVSTL